MSLIGGNDMSFAEKIKLLRKEKGLSQTQLAITLNIGRSCLSMLEIGRNEPTASNLSLFADFFGCTTDYLLGREDPDESLTFLPPVLADEQFTQEEKEALQIYRTLDRELQQRALVYLRRLGELVKAEKSLPLRK